MAKKRKRNQNDSSLSTDDSIEASLSHLEREENFVWDHASSRIAVKIRSEGEDCFFPRASTQDIRAAFVDKTFGDGYWLAQAIHYGLPLTINQKAIRKSFRRELRHKEYLTAPVRLLHLGSRLQDQANDELVVKQEVIVKQEVERDHEPIARRKEAREKVDSDEDYIASKDDASESEGDGDSGSEEGDNSISQKEIQELEPTRRSRLPRHADRPVRSVEQPGDYRRSASGDESDRSDCNEDTPPTSVARSRTKSKPKSAKFRTKRVNFPGQESDSEVESISSPSFTRPRTSKNQQHLRIILPDHLSDASNYLTAETSTASSPSSTASANPTAKQPPASRSARPRRVDEYSTMGGNLSTEVPTGQDPGDSEQQSSSLIISGFEFGALPHRDGVRDADRALSSLPDDAVQRVQKNDSWSAIYRQAKRDATRDSPAEPARHPLTTPTENSYDGGNFVPDDMSEDEQMQFAIALSKSTALSEQQGGQFTRQQFDQEDAGNRQPPMQSHVSRHPSGLDGQNQAHHATSTMLQAAADRKRIDKSSLGGSNDAVPSGHNNAKLQSMALRANAPAAVTAEFSTSTVGKSVQSTGVNSGAAGAIRCPHEPFDLSLIRSWVPQDCMDMGVVYNAQKASDGYLVRTHETVIQHMFPVNAHNLGQTRLFAEETLMRSLHEPMTPRVGHDKQWKKVQERKMVLCQKSAKEVSLKPIDVRPSVPDHPGIEGNVSYNGHSRIPWQLQNFGAADRRGFGLVDFGSGTTNVPSAQAATSSTSSNRISARVTSGTSARAPGLTGPSEPQPSANTIRGTAPARPQQDAQGHPPSTSRKVEAERDNVRGEKSKHADRKTTKKRKGSYEEVAETGTMSVAKKAKKRKCLKSPSPVVATESKVPALGTGAPSSGPAPTFHTENRQSINSMKASTPPQHSTPRVPRHKDACSREKRSKKIRGKCTSERLSTRDDAQTIAGDDETGSPASTSAPALPTDTEGTGLSNQVCGWVDCDSVCEDAAALFEHVKLSHVGFKMDNTLNLTCGWVGCGRTVGWRDSAVRHIFQHVNHISHPCSACDNGYTSHDKLLKHIADEHSGGVLVGQGFSSATSAANANRPQSQQVGGTRRTSLSTLNSPPAAAQGGNETQDVEMHDVERESVKEESSDSRDQEQDEGEEDAEASGSGDQQSDSGNDEPGDELEESVAEDDRTRAFKTEEATTTSTSRTLSAASMCCREFFPVKKLLDRHQRRAYVHIDLDKTLRSLQSALDRGLTRLRRPEIKPEISKQLKKKRRQLHEWQTIAHKIYSGAMETPAEAQLRAGLEGLEAVKEQLKKRRGKQRREKCNDRLKRLEVKVKDAREAVEAERRAGGARHVEKWCETSCKGSTRGIHGPMRTFLVDVMQGYAA